MPSSNAISLLYKKQQHAFLKQLKAAASLNEENIHQLRVKAKHLVSLYKFLGFLSDQTFKRRKAAQLITPVFKCAGHVREQTLNIRQPQAHRSTPLQEFTSHLRGHEVQDRKALRKAIEAFDHKKFRKQHKKILKAFNRLDNAFILKKSKAYLDRRIIAIKADLAAPAGDETFHDIRKKLKDIKTTSQVVKVLPKGKKTAAAYLPLNLLEESIGQWHDEVVLIARLGTYLADQAQANDSAAQLHGLILKLTARKELHKQRMAAHMQSVLGQYKEDD